MKPLSRILPAVLALIAFGQTAQAADAPDCQILIMEPLEVKDAPGEAMVASYFPAAEFIDSVQDDAPDHLSEVNGQKIRALMCTRNDVLPAESDYDFLGTGIPFVLSQDFDSPDTDSLTLYWKDGQIEHVYKGEPLSEEGQVTLDTRLAAFSQNGLNPWAREMAVKAEAEDAMKEEEKEATKPNPENVVVASFDKTEGTDVINTAGTSNSINFALDDFDATDTEEISLSGPETFEATKLNIQTKN